MPATLIGLGHIEQLPTTGEHPLVVTPDPPLRVFLHHVPTDVSMHIARTSTRLRPLVWFTGTIIGHDADGIHVMAERVEEVEPDDSSPY